jgi:hypothetical protein
MHDSAGLFFPHLAVITPQLKTLFGQVAMSVTAITREKQPEAVKRLQEDDFFKLIYYPIPLPVGDEFLTLYAEAVAAYPAETVLHLCFIDRVAFALRNGYQTSFMDDVRAVTAAETPLIFTRSETAWKTHPMNYWELEQMMTRVGELLFQQSLDFAWCHLAVQAGQLRDVLPALNNWDLSMMAELVLRLKDHIQTKAVDWLAWEDPFIYGVEPEQLKREREQSQAETQKRLAYVVPMLQRLVGF